MKTLAVSILAVFAVHAVAQDQVKVSAQTTAYEAYRVEYSTPPYGLDKIRALIRKTEATDDDRQILSAKAYNSLSTKEKFTYCMIHPENEQQNCDAMPATSGEEKRIFSHPTAAFDGDWSDRQKQFLSSHRKTVISLLRKTIRTNHRVGVNLKAAILEVHGSELIPDLEAVYKKDHKDQDILSTMLVLMTDANYKPFKATRAYHLLYGEKDSNYKSSIAANPQNEKLCLDRAMAFYKSRFKA